MKISFYYRFLDILILSLLWTVIGCEKTSVNHLENTKQDASKQLYIEVSALGSADYFYDHREGMELAGKALGVQTEYVGPPDLDIAAMITMFEQAIAKKPNGIVVVGFESALNAIVDKAVDAGIPVVTVDADLPGSKRIAFVGTGNFQAGVQCGKKLASLIEYKGQVALMTKPGQSNLDERIEGFKKALSDFPGIQMVQIADSQTDVAVAAQATASLLQKYPDLKGMGCVDGNGAIGTAIAVREAGKIGKVKIVSMDRGNDILEHIKDGVISASIAQQTVLMPFYATQILYNLNNYPASITSDNMKAGAPGIPCVIDTGIVIVDASNYQYFIRN